MILETQKYLDFSDVLIKPKRSILSSRADVVLLRTFTCSHSGVSWTGVPIIAANLDTVGTFEIARIFSKFNMLTAIHKHYTVEEWSAFKQTADEKVLNNIFVTTGISDKDFNKLDEILTICPEVNKICIDVANGYTQTFIKKVEQLRKIYPNKMILAGNVVSYEMAEELLLNGASIVKVGIGSGAFCLTRKMTGVGVPQLSAVIECADAAHGLNGLICSDGGCVVPGDISKAFAGGADFVMLGGMLTGHEENAGETIIEDDKKYKVSYGMSSKQAFDKYSGGNKQYRASEGKEVKVKYKGFIEDTIIEILGGIRSTCTYVGASKLKELSKRTTFILVNNQINESLGKS